jgi:hypothetical protein
MLYSFYLTPASRVNSLVWVLASEVAPDLDPVLKIASKFVRKPIA